MTNEILIKALSSPGMMDAYLELSKTEDIISDIKAYAQPDRVKIATAAMQGIVSNHHIIDSDNWKWLAENSVKVADALIAELNKEK